MKSCPNSTPKRIQIPVVSSTHYDREWRFSFQQTRMMLRDLIDHLLEIFAQDPEFCHYHTDSQSVILEDYLELRPERRDEIRDFVQSGRLLAGPWYTLPDMNVIGGEPIVRNLLTGHRVVSDFGPVMKVGYTPTGFGHISQLPQIYAGFGIDTALFYRGPDRTTLNKEFVWEAPDGSSVVAYIFTPEFGRIPLYHCITRRALYNQKFYERDRHWDAGEGPFRVDDGRTRWDLYFQSRIQEGFHIEALASELERLIKTELADSAMESFLLLDGSDSTEPEPNTPRIIEKLNALSDKYEFVHAPLTMFADQLRDAAVRLPHYSGEMRSSAKKGVQVNLLADTITARLDLKQMNVKTEQKLVHWAEPLATMAWTGGAEYPDLPLETAWRYLLVNQSHDCIAGCGVDIVHDDMVYYFRQAQELSDEISRRAMFHLAANIDGSRFSPDEVLIIVFNPLPFERTEVVSTRIDVPEGWDSIRLTDADGQEMPLEIVSNQGSTRKLIHRPRDAPGFYEFNAIETRFVADKIPALGYKTFRVQRGAASACVGGTAAEAVGPTIENEFFQLSVREDGRFDLTDKGNRRTYAGLHEFVDCGEAGDAYQRADTKEDELVLGPGESCTVEVHRGDLQSEIKVDFALSVPSTSSRERRSSQRTNLPIRVTAALRRGCPWVAFRTEVDNRAQDHRLNVRFPSGLAADHVTAEMPFDLVNRATTLPDTTDWFEQAYASQPMRSFVSIATKDAGLGLLSPGLAAYEIDKDEAGTLVLTLLRCCRVMTPKLKTSDPTQNGTQCLGKHVFEYAVMPFDGESTLLDVQRSAHAFNLPMRVAQSGRQIGTRPVEHSFVRVNTPFVMSAVKRSELGDSVILRFWNAAEEEAEAVVVLGFPVAKAWQVSLEEVRKSALPVDGSGRIRLRARGKEIMTVELAQPTAA